MEQLYSNKHVKETIKKELIVKYKCSFSQAFDSNVASRYWQRFFAWSNFSQDLEPFLGPCVHVLVKSSFSKNPAKSVNQKPPTSICDILNIWWGSLSSTIPNMMSDHSDLSSFSKNPVSWFSQNPPYSWCFLLEIFYSLTSILLLVYKFPLAHVIFGVEPNLSPSL